MDKIFTIYPNLKVLDASINIKNVIKEDEVNPHVWTSIEIGRASCRERV